MSNEWKKRLLPASWRGIPFFVETHELSGGRHAVKNEWPDRNASGSEDVGRRGKQYRIEAHVLGDNYFFIRDALIIALEDEGPGTLIHPYLGVKEVQPDSYVVRESTSEGRVVRFSMTFVEIAELSFPFSVIDTVTAFASSVVAAVEAVKGAFLLAYKVAELPAYAQQSAKLMTENFATTVSEGFKNVRLKGDEHSRLNSQTNELHSTASSASQSGTTMASSVDVIVSGLKTLVPESLSSFTVDSSSGRDDRLVVFTPLLTWRGGADDVLETTAVRQLEKQSANALADLVQTIGVIRLSEKVVEKTFTSIVDAVTQRKIVTDAIKRIQELERTDDDVFSTLDNLMATLIAAVPRRVSRYSNTKNINIPATTSSLEFVFNTFGNLDNEQDFINRNKIINPVFVTGDVEVLIQ